MLSASTRLLFLGGGFLVGFEEGLLDVGGDELVAAEGHGEGTAAAGEGAQGGAVAVHLGQRSFGFQSGVFALGIHAHDDGAATLQVGHHATLCLGGHGDGDVVDRLLDLRGSLLEGLAEGGTAGNLEGRLVGVHRVHLTVVDVDDDVAGVGTGQRTLLHLLHDTLEDGGHEAGVNRTTHDAVVEDQLAAPLQRILLGVADGVLGLVGHAIIVGLDKHVDLAELAATTRLFLVAVHGLGALGDGLAVGDDGGREVDGQLVLVLEVPLHGVEVQLALAAEDDLAQLAAVLEREAAVVGHEVLQRGADLLVVVAVGCLDGDGVDGSREDDLLDGVVGVLRGGEGRGSTGLLCEFFVPSMKRLQCTENQRKAQ